MTVHSLFLFVCRYSDLRLIDIPSLKESLPLTILDLKKNVHKATQQRVKRLMEMWIPSCVKIISDRRDYIEECMPEDEVILKHLVHDQVVSNVLRSRSLMGTLFLRTNVVGSVQGP